MKNPFPLSLSLTLGLLPLTLLPRPAQAQEEPKFKIHFDYSKVQESLFTPDVKRMIESGAALLQSYIATEGELTITVVNDETGNAYATGAPSEWEVDTAEKSIAKTGGIRFGTKHVIDARDKGSDLTALVMHEIMHCLGSVSSAKAIAKNLKPGGMYEGPNAVKMNNGKPVAFDGSHYKAGFKDVFGVMPRISNGGGDTLSILDLAILADLGYEIPLIKKAGGKVPPVTFHYPENYFGFMTYGPTKYRMLAGEGGSDLLEAHEYTQDGKKGSYILIGGGGGDVLIAGPGSDIMDANSLHFRNGTPTVAGKATYVFRHNSGNATIYGFASGTDKIYIDPEKEIDMEKLEAAIKASEEEKIPGTNSYRPGNWVIKVGDFQIIVNTTDDEKPKVSDFVIAEWKPAK